MNQDVTEAGSALFTAQNLLTQAWNKINGPATAEETLEAQQTITDAQDQIRKAIRHLGGVNALLNAGA